MRIFAAGISSLVTLVFLLAGCNSDPVKVDIVNYSKSAIQIYNKYEADISKKMDEAKNARKKEDYIPIINKELLPLYKEYKEKMAAIKPVSKELQDIHNAFITALGASEEGLTMLAKSITSADQKLSKSASDKIDAAGQGNEKYKKDFNELAKRHGVKID